MFDVSQGCEDDSEFSITGASQASYFGRNRQLSTILMAGMVLKIDERTFDFDLFSAFCNVLTRYWIRLNTLK